MTHDPLCYMTDCTHPDPHGDFKATCGYCTAYCQCVLIAKVRADTLSRVMKRVEKVPFIEPKHADWFTHIAGAKPDIVRHDVLTAIGTLRATS